ncbi:MAG: 4Fe-4S dicluster domain-containing protein [Kiritimatiellaeota bacterium]|nr:4Fe-4S dicluster domain-containing protein [Kiritimatiellota bacterium]
MRIDKEDLPVPDPEVTAANRAQNAIERGDFLRKAAMLAAGTCSLAVGAAATVSRREAPARVPAQPDGADLDNPLERMRRELERALRKPMEERKWVMVIDRQKCIGCKACTVSCAVENDLPPGVVYRPVTEDEVGQFPHVRRVFLPRPCMQCEKPPCTPVCPVTATYRRPDGVVVVDYDICIGCRYCLNACPYNARTADFGEFFTEPAGREAAGLVGEPATAYEHRATFEYGKSRRREHGKERSPMGNARKCHFCLHRVENGMLPACVATCLGGATLFGDYGDPASLVHELVGSTRVTRLKEDLGTEPSVFYLA